MTTLSLRRCFYLSAVVVILSTSMAALIIVKLSPLESIKCQPPHVVTSPVEWSTSSNLNNNNNKKDINHLSNGELIIAAVNEDKLIRNQEINDKNYAEMRERIIKDKLNRISNRMIKNGIPYIGGNASIEPNYNVHIFYYPWYRNLVHDKLWKHWNHDYLPNWKKNDKRIYPDGKHKPPEDIGSNYYPSIGCYSSLDSEVKRKREEREKF